MMTDVHLDTRYRGYTFEMGSPKADQVLGHCRTIIYSVGQ